VVCLRSEHGSCSTSCMSATCWFTAASETARSPAVSGTCSCRSPRSRTQSGRFRSSKSTNDSSGTLLSMAANPAMARAAFVVVPAYNEAQVLAGSVRALTAAALRVVVVDDGSTDETSVVARAAGATVLRHVVNRGQGAALQTGIGYALRRGAEQIITFDA